MPNPGLIIPYCGAPPLPDALWARWNLDPALIVVLAALLGVYALGERLTALVAAPPKPSRRDVAFFASGWAILSAALISPLCALSVALFSARVGQHMIIAMIAAPLMVLGSPVPRFAALLPSRWANQLTRAFEVLANKVTAALLFATFLWMWHTPFFYGATFRSDLVYLTMHLTMFGSAFLLWHGLLVRGLDQPLLAFGTGFATTLQMSLLGALLTFATRPLFTEHLLTSAWWGFTPVEDQQLGGLIMWVPGCTVLILAGIVLFGQLLRALDGRGLVVER